MRKRYQVSLIAITLLLVCAMLLASSYAMWTVNGEQEDENIIATGCFDATLTENNAINLVNTYPMSDTEGMKTQLYTFTIKNTCTIDSAFQVNLESLSTTTLEAQYVKISFDGSTPALLSTYANADKIISTSIASKKLATGTLPPGISVTYSLRLWMDENADNDQQNKTFESKIVVTLAATETQEPEYKIGDEVQIINGGTIESFYVIKDSYEIEDTVTLLSKFNIDIENNKQYGADTTYSEYGTAFSTSAYWDSVCSSTYPCDLNGIESAEVTAIKAANNYGTKTGGTGRLLTYEEAIALRSSNSNILYGKNIGVTQDYLYYWLGSASSSDRVWFVYGKNSTLGTNTFSHSGGYGVRPVIEVPKSALLGKEVTVGDEHFYVIGSNGDKLTLLSKYNLDITNNKQYETHETPSQYATAFSTSTYWTTCGSYPCNLNGIDNAAATVVNAAKSYGTKLGGTGRLMTYKELRTLVTLPSAGETLTGDTEMLKIINGTYTNRKYLRYWLGSAYDSSRVWCIGGGAYGANGYNYYNDNSGFGVRPVIEIPRTSVKLA